MQQTSIEGKRVRFKWSKTTHEGRVTKDYTTDSGLHLVKIEVDSLGGTAVSNFDFHVYNGAISLKVIN